MSVEFGTWKCDQLRAELKKRGAPVKGNKKDLVERLCFNNNK